MRLIDQILPEFEHECATTERLLERLPEGKLDWRPHPKSRTLGELACHLAAIPGMISTAVLEDRFDMKDGPGHPAVPGTVGEILRDFEESIRSARKALVGLDDSKAVAPWRLLKGGKEVFTLPRIGVIRSVLLNHSYHHRGQLSLYLRLLDIPVPSIYGPSADEDPFDRPEA
jgi:uncharacterized damage-inducible protein DinB